MMVCFINRHVVIALAVMLGSLFISSAAFSATYERTYTVNADFLEGTLDGVNCETIQDQLQLNVLPTTFGYAWIANSGDGTISKIDTKIGCEVARYRTGPLGGIESPSRTAVDLDGNCWVANRGTGTVVKILAEGGINTSTGPGDIKPWGSDDRVVMCVHLGNNANSLPRAMAIDKNGNIWVGLYNESRYAVVDGTSGAVITYVPSEIRSYGAAIDKNGILWNAGLGEGVEKIDTNSMSSVAIYRFSGGYGIAVDADGVVWEGAYPHQGVFRFDPATQAYQYCLSNGYTSGRGVCIARDGDVWVALGYGSPNHNVAKYNSAGALLAIYSLGGYNPCGVGTDFDGNILVVCQDSNAVYKLNEEDGSVMWQVPVGNVPYTYSDFTGYAIRNLTQKTGSWTTVFDSEQPGMAWGNISWNCSAPGDSSVGVRVRAADDTADLVSQSWLIVENAQQFANISGRFIEVEARLSTTTEDSPILYDLTVKSANHPPVAVAVVNSQESVTVEQESYAGTAVTLDGSQSYDPDGDQLIYEWDLDNDGTYETSGAGVQHTYNRGGPYTAVLKVTDPGGLSSTDTVSISVVDTTPPVITNIQVDPNVLWPPNHKMVPIAIAAIAADKCDSEPVLKVVNVTCNEPVNGLGDGNTEPDFIITGAMELMLRSERSGNGTDRVYTIHLLCTDASGNSTSATATVVVPHDQKK